MAPIFKPAASFVEFSEAETEQSIALRFERQVERFPDRIAVWSTEASLCYDALNKKANRLARAIVSRQHGTDRPVLLFLEHDMSAIIGILGALKAGKIFVPLDPSVPQARFDYVLKDSQADLIVTNCKNLPGAASLLNESSRMIDIDALDANFADENLAMPMAPDDVSWILYTSGSTGQPKGVVQTHRNELYNIRNHTNALGIGAEDRVTLLGSHRTGQGMQDIYTALLNGAALYPLNIKADGLGQLARLLNEEKITIYHSAATLFRHFVYSLSDGQNFPALRVVRLGSETVNWKDVELFKRHFSGRCVLVNALSSSECRTYRQCFMTKETTVASIVPVGYQVEGKTVLVLDENGNQASEGEAGEIAVRSRYITPGYWRRPDLTAAAFSTERCAGGERLFLTGDLGRLTSDGKLEHLGRKDFQVKIRGYRVEPREVELALLEVPGVREAVVLARPDRGGEKRLVAYVAAIDRKVITANRLRNALQAKLPDYLIPAAFVMLERLPLTPTGKLAPHCLPEPGAERPELDSPFVASRRAVEKIVAELWCEVLELEAVGVDDDFTQLGGDSLRAARIAARLNEWFSPKQPVKTPFATCTVAALSSFVTAQENSPGDAERIAAAVLKVADMSADEIAGALGEEGGRRDNG